MLSALIDHLWQSTLFAGGVGILTVVMRRNGAGVRFTLWLTASVKFLVPFTLLAMLGSHIPRRAINLEAVAAAPQALRAAIDSLVAPMSATRLGIGAATAISAPTYPLLNFLEIVWAGGVLVIATFWLAGWIRIRRTLAISRPAAMDFPIPVRTSTAMQEPAVAGIVRPILLLPDGIERWLSGEQLHAVLAHERCHVRRRDNLTAALHMVVEAVFWFHPLVWWLETRLVAERERACDEEVLTGGNKSQDYAEGILRICQNYLESPLRCAAGVGGGNLTRRIEFILNPPRRVRVSALQFILLAVIAGAVVAEPIVSGHLAAPVAPLSDTPGSPTWVFRNYVAVIAPDTHSDGKDMLTAAAGGDLAQVRRLLHEGVAVDFQDGVTALTAAAQNGRDAVVQELLASGARVEHPRSGGETALMLSAGTGHVSIVKRLLKAGAHVNDREDTGYTALMAAAAAGHQEVVQVLLNSGADLRPESKFGETALLLAARSGNDGVVRLLLDFGADFRHREFDGETALDLAVQGRQVAVMQALLERGAGSKP